MSGGEEARLLGKWGERLAASYLQEKGWRIIAVNYRCRHGEIDIIAAHEGYLAFVEVKLRRSTHFGRPAEFVTTEKQKRISTAAEIYLLNHPTKLQPRFDVVEILAPQGLLTKTPEIIHFENAF